MSAPLIHVDVIIVPGATDEDSVARTLRSLTTSELIEIHDVVVTALASDKLPMDADNGLSGITIRNGGGRGALSGLRSMWTLVVRAGDTIPRKLFTDVLRETREGIVQDLYALQPTTAYGLRKGVRRLSTLLINSHQRVPWTGLPGFFVRTAMLEQVSVADIDSPIGGIEFFLELFSAAGRARMVPGSVVISAPLDDAYAAENYRMLYAPDWYMRLNEFFSDLLAVQAELRPPVVDYLHQVYVYMLWRRIQSNKNAADRHALDDERFAEFKNGASRVLSGIAPATIARPAFGRIDIPTRIFMMRLARDAAHHSHVVHAADVSLSADGYSYASAAEVKVRIECMNIDNDVLRIDGRHDFPKLPGASIEAVYDGHSYPIAPTERYAALQAFGEPIFEATPFTVEIPLKPGRVRPLRFFYAVTGAATASQVLLDFSFPRPSARLTGTKYDFWAVDSYMLQYRAGRIVIRPAGRREKFRQHLNVIRELRKSLDPIAREAARVRILYLLTRPFFRGKRIWLYFDKLYKAGDNAEYAYRNAIAQKDGILKRYILIDDVPDAKRFRKLRLPFVRYRSLRQILLFLNSEVIFATHSNVHNFGGHHGRYERYYRGLYRYKVFFIQHGLTVQEFARTLNRVYNNIDSYCIASPVERKTLSDARYAYKDTDILSTGVPRYDGLDAGLTRKMILISPTWRNYLAAPPSMGEARPYSKRFKKSAYFHSYNSLINSKKLIDTARRTGYEILFLLHPVTSSQKGDFDQNNVVRIQAATEDTSYEQLLSEASVLVTDYSGIQFDFAYMRKPIVYLHDPMVPASYDESVYRYETDALGTVCDSVGKVVDELCAQMEDGICLAPGIQDRIDRFFYHSDRNNAQRVYEAARGRFG